MYESTSGDKATFGVGYLEDHVRVTKRVDCPACSQLAMVEMAAYVDRMTGEKAVFAVNQLFCSHCRLTVAGPAELEAVGLETSVEVNFSEEPRDVVESTLSGEAQRYWERRDHWAIITGRNANVRNTQPGWQLTGTTNGLATIRSTADPRATRAGRPCARFSASAVAKLSAFYLFNGRFGWCGR